MTEEIERQAALFAALAYAQNEALAVEKDARNDFHRYDYVSAEAVIGAKHHLNRHGLALIPLTSSFAPSESMAGHQVLSRDYVLTHEGGGTRLIEQKWVFAEGKGRPWDKALAGALTTSLAYLYRDLLALPRVDPSDDISGRDDRDHQPTPRSQRQAPSRPPEPPPRESMDEDEIFGWLNSAPITGTPEERREYVNARRDYAVALAELRTAIGGKDVFTAGPETVSSQPSVSSGTAP